MSKTWTRTIDISHANCCLLAKRLMPKRYVERSPGGHPGDHLLLSQDPDGIFSRIGGRGIDESVIACPISLCSNYLYSA